MTEQKELVYQLALLETFFNHAPLGFAFVDRDYRFMQANEVMARIHALSVTELLGKKVAELVPQLWPTLEPVYARVLAGETILNHEVSGPAPSTEGQIRHWQASHYPIRLQGEILGIAVIVNDITEQRQAEAALQIRKNLYAMLAGTNRAVSQCRSALELFRSVCEIAVETGKFRFAWIGVPEGDVMKLLASAGNDGGYMAKAVITLDPQDPRSQGPTGQAMATGEIFIVNDFMAAEMTRPWHAYAQEVGFAASATFPIQQRGQVCAVLSLYASTADFFSDSLVETLREIMPALSFALDAFQDEIERKQAEDALQEAEAHYRKLFEYAPDGIVIADTQSYYVDANASVCRMLGYQRDELIGLHASDIVDLSEVEHIAPALKTITNELDYYREWRFRRKDGSGFYAEVIATMMPDGHLLGMIRDITERKLAEHRIRQLNRVYAVLSDVNQTIVREKDPQILLETACRIAVEKGLFRMAWIGLLDPESNCIKVKAHAGASPDTIEVLTTMLGLDQELCQCVFTYHALHTGEHGICTDIAQDPDAANWREAGLARGYASMASLPLKIADRVVGTFNLYAGERDFFNPDEMRLLDEMAMDIGFALEVSEREGELQLRDRAIKAVSQGIVITDPTLPDNPIIFASPGFEQMTGYSAAESIGKNCRFLQGPETDPEAIQLIRAALRIGQGCSVELLNYRKDGSRFWNNLTISAVLNKNGQITHFVGVQSDVTQRRELEGQVRQAQKMEAIGQLAGGIAHDFNNLLTIINGYSELLLADTPAEDSRHALIQEILKAGEWSASLTGQLLAFSRKQVLQPQVLDLNGVIRETHKMLCRVLGEDIQLSIQLQPHLNAVKADPGQLAQVLVNLALNARDSMPQGGVLTIETSHAGLSETNSQAARTVCLSVTDTGAGMTPEIKNRLFEPFFTTKESGKGTGLGLPVVQGIVEQSGGQIEVFSQPGVGTSFKIYWPAQGLAPGTQTEPPDKLSGTHGNETILLVEDDASVRALIKLILQEQGYHVLDARRGEEALRLAASHTEPIDLLLTDVVMPGIGGRVLAERLKAERPELKVLFMSGYTDDAVVRHGILHKHVNFLLKPFLPTALAHKIREVLATPHSDHSERIL